MKQILLLTDFSENSINAIQYALEFSKNEACHFYLMHVHKASSFTTGDLMLSPSNNVYDSIIKAPKQRLTKLAEDLEQQHQNTNHHFEIIVDFDNFTDSVNQVVKSKNIDLIVVGTNGSTGAQEVIFGSNTLNVVRKVPCTTLVIPEGYKYKPLYSVLLPLDSRDTVSGSSIKSLKDFLVKQNLNLNVLRVNPDNDNPEFTLFDRSNLEGLKYDYFIINNVPVHYATNSFIQIEPIDLIAILVKDEGFFSRLFSGSMITKLSSALRLPMLVLHNN